MPNSFLCPSDMRATLMTSFVFRKKALLQGGGVLLEVVKQDLLALLQVLLLHRGSVWLAGSPARRTLSHDLLDVVVELVQEP